MRSLFRLSAASLLAALVAADARAEERILEFRAEITVEADGAVLVRETIRVTCEGQRIKRGIYRDLPTVQRAGGFLVRRIPFEVVETLRDGKPENRTLEPIRNGVRIKLGRPTASLKPGEYTYTLAYRMGRQVRFFDDHDELYWNATGDAWAFRIERAEAVVRLPEAVPRDRLELVAYSGPRGAKGQDWSAEVNEAGEAVFATTRPLAPGEGLTISVSWPKGFVAPPPGGAAGLAALLHDNREVFIGAAGAAFVGLYLLLVWLAVGRDPGRGVIRPQAEPPEDVSPAAARYVMRMGFDHKCFIAALINMAIKGFLTINEKAKVFVLERGSEGEEALFPEEQALAHRLFAGGRSRLELKQTHHTRIRGAIQALAKRLAKQYRGRTFRTNRLYMLPAVAVSVATILLAGFRSALLLAPFVFICVWLAGWTAGVFALLRTVAGLWRAAISGRGPGRPSVVGKAVFMSLFAVPFVGGEVVGLVMLSQVASPAMVPVVALLGVLNALFLYLLKAPTPAGRRLMDRIEGFRIYLNPPRRSEAPAAQAGGYGPRSIEAFERFLPYALALDVEDAWAAAFEEALSEAAVAPGREGSERYNPGWYVGRSWHDLGARGLSSGLGGALAGAVAAASASSSSGSGGGGSSGGGGGGGGGGGW